MSDQDRTEYYYPNQTLCSVLEAMRSCDKTKNYSYLMGLIENAQYLADRMEAALGDARDVKRLTELRSELKSECKKLEKQLEELKTQLPKEEKK